MSLVAMGKKMEADFKDACTRKSPNTSGHQMLRGIGMHPQTRDKIAGRVNRAKKRWWKRATVETEVLVIETAREVFGKEVAMQLVRAVDKKRAEARAKARGKVVK